MSSPTSSLGLLILRLGFSGLMITHGWAKLSAYSDLTDSFPDPLGVGSNLSLIMAIGAEFFAAIALGLGLFTRLSTLPLIATMAVAAFLVHQDDPFAKKELALLYLIAFGALLLTGGGSFSIDGMRQRRKAASMDE